MLDYAKIPFRCIRCHCYGHVFKDYDKPIVKKVWRKKEVQGASRVLVELGRTKFVYFTKGRM